MPCWWMPASCAKAFSPTMALLRGTGMPVMFDTRRDWSGTSRVVLMPVSSVEEVVARPQRHHDFFQRAIAGAFADAVDGAFDLPRARDHGGEAVGHRQAEIVVAMHAESRTLSMPRTCLRR